MKELTLTGGTLLDAEPVQSCHGFDGFASSTAECGATPTPAQRAANELVQQGDSVKIVEVLFGIVRMGPYSLFFHIIQSWKAQSGTEEVEKQIKTAKDNHGGYSLLHWAAKRADSSQFVQFLLPFIPLSVTSPSDDTGMNALHWACTESNALPIVRLMVNHDRFAVEVTDATGCTPLLIASQHGHVETVAYLLQHGANINAVDASRDSATHWAAYKGSRQVLGLLSYYDTRQLTTADLYGQSPLHLAALRGHKSSCKYILSHVDKNQRLKLLDQKDRNGKTPYDLAVNKGKVGVAAFLSECREELTCTRLQKCMRAILRNIRNLASPASWKLWLGMTVDGSENMDESPVFPYYYVCLHLLMHPIFQVCVFWAIRDSSEGVLWDCVLILVWHFFVYLMSVYSFVRVSSGNPGRIDANLPNFNDWRQLYEVSLEQYACETVPGKFIPQLCHTCHIARPPRSKHDRFTDCCILVFDHHCPFVGNSIGLFNYKWFFLFLATSSIGLIQHCILLFVWWKRHAQEESRSSIIATLLFGVVLGIHGIFPTGMCIYHTQLTAKNLTTNEAINTQKYAYLWGHHHDTGGGPSSCNTGSGPSSCNNTSHKHFLNPFDHGVCANAFDRLFSSSDKSSKLEEEMVTLLRQGRGSGSSAC